MKKVFFYNAIILLSLMIMSSTCSVNDDDDDELLNNSSEIASINDDASNGVWVITYYYDTDHEETSNFTGYTFTFGSNGVLTATNGVNTYTGSWSVTDDSSSSTSSSDDIDFNIAFSSPSDFEELTDDWEIISHTSTRIELRDISGGNGGTDFLTFERN